MPFSPQGANARRSMRYGPATSRAPSPPKAAPAKKTADGRFIVGPGGFSLAERSKAAEMRDLDMASLPERPEARVNPEAIPPEAGETRAGTPGAPGNPSSSSGDMLRQKFDKAPAPELAERLRAESARLGAVAARGGSSTNSTNRHLMPMRDFLYWTGLDEWLPGSVVEATVPRRLVLRQKAEIRASLDAFNARKPGRDVRFFDTPKEVILHGNATLRPGEGKSYVCTVFGGNHALVLHLHRHDIGLARDTVTCLVLDSTKVGDDEAETLPVLLARGLALDSDKEMEAIDSYLICFGGMHRDGASCIGYAPDYLKSLENHPDIYQGLHEQAFMRNGAAHRMDTEGKYRYLDTEQAIQTLPLEVFKNLQSTEMAATLVNMRPEALFEPLNPRKRNPELSGETFLSRLLRLTGYEWALPKGDGSGEYVKNPEVPKRAKSLAITRRYAKFYGEGAKHVAAANSRSISPGGQEGAP